MDNQPTGVKRYVAEVKGLLNYGSEHMNRAEKPQYNWRGLLSSLRTSAASALKDHEKSDLDPDQDHLPKSDLRSRSDPDLT